MDTNDTYLDRYGVRHEPPVGAVIKTRCGVWTIARAHDAVLFLWPRVKHTINVLTADLPGGGVEADEALDKAAQREFYEETGLVFSPTTPLLATHRQVWKTYAEGSDEYWNYDQTFFLYGYERQVETDIIWTNPEGDRVAWKKIMDLNQIEINRAHRAAIHKMMPELNEVGR